MVAERSFHAPLGRIHVALQHDLGVRRHAMIHRLAPHHVNGLAAQKAREHHLVYAGWQRRGRRIDRRRRRAEHHRHLQPLLLALGVPVVLGAALVQVPVHTERLIVEDLEPIHADVALAGVRIVREHQRQGDVAAAIVGPALQDRQLRELEVLTTVHLLARRGGDQPRSGRGNAAELVQRLELAAEALGWPGERQGQQVLDLRAQVFPAVNAQGPRRPPIGAEGIHHDRHGATLHVAEQQGRAVQLAHPVGDLGDL